MEPNDYTHFEVVDFFSDENFARYALNPQESDLAYWTRVRSQYPEKVPAMDEALQWIALIRQQNTMRDSKPAEQMWQQIQARIIRHNQWQERFIIPFKKSVRWLATAAAVVLVYFGANELLHFGRHEFEADYGVLRNINFPDESIVTLNSNSRVYYNRNWKSDKPREVWLEGEAFFQVKHVALKNRVQESDSFKVHVNGLDLTVLGTQFNVKDRRGITEISLVEGKLRIDKPGITGFVKVMKPGEIYRYDGQRLEFGRGERTAQATQSWTRKELALDGYTLRDVIHVLEDNFGYRVNLKAPELENRRLSGVLPLTSDKDILFVIEKVFEVKIKQHQKDLVIDR